jgi:hypothetical protein
MTVLVAKYTVFRFTVVNVATSVTIFTSVNNVPMVIITISENKVVYKDNDKGDALKLLGSADIS